MAEAAPKKRSFGERCCMSVSTSLRQFFLILGKNFLLQFRRPVGTFCEIILPLLAVVFIVGFRLGLNALQATDECFVTFESDPLEIPDTAFNVYYSPNTSNATILAGYIQQSLANSGGSLTGLSTEDEMVEVINQGNATGQNPCFVMGSVGIYFNDVDSDNIAYTLRFPQNTWFTSDIASDFRTLGARVAPNPYLDEGFMQLEKIVDEAIIAWKTGYEISVDVSVRQFPYPPYRQDFFLPVVSGILPLFLILSLIYSAGAFVKELVLEKETRIRETMKMMGLDSWVLWTTWYLKQILFYLPVLIIMTILLKYGQVFPESDGFLLFVFLQMFMLSGIAFCFFISAWFSSARIGLFAGFIIWFVFYFPYFFIVYDNIDLGTKVGLCLISNTCIGLAVNVLSALELRQEGLTFANFARPISLDDNFHMGWVVLMLFIDTIIYMVLYWYIDAVKPGKYGVPKPFYFFVLPSYWYKKKSKPLESEELAQLSNFDFNATSHEPEPTDIPIGITIEGLTKVYNRHNLKKRKLAVDRLSLKMYKGQITALLGHNGAGKTTTLSILTGLFPPTQGNAHINGLSVVDDIDLIRNNLGICPQHNVLFDRLTVCEHLYFFGLLKGCPRKKVSEDVKVLIKDLLLEDKSGVQSQKLSGGMKRKLSVGIALVGGSEIVILDEPTSGMDPYARRATWDLLTKHKEGRTMLLTTHFMDEADQLGDRIAIMSEGQLRCSGSSLFLKSRYGVGYHLTIVKEPTCDSTVVSDLVKQMVTGSDLCTDVGAELSFVLPSQSAHLFPELFDTFNERKVSLGISSFGVSVTTMEEVFIRVASDTEHVLLESTSKTARQISQQDPGSSLVHSNQPTVAESALKEEGKGETQVAVINDKEESDEVQVKRETFELEQYPPILPDEYKGGINSGLFLWFQQFCAMFLKRVYHSIRFWAAIIWQLIIPLLFVLWGLLVARFVPGINSDPISRLLSLPNSAPSNNITFFWASFTSNPAVTFEASDQAILGTTDYFDYTDEVLDIVGRVQHHTNDLQCCDYRRQILDKHCATRTLDDLRDPVEVCRGRDNFGYKSCTNCLNCCETKDGRAATCTDGRQRGTQANAAFFARRCPVPPAVSINDQSGTGPVDNMNVFVAEQLLNVSDQFHVFDFFLRFQGGYVLHSPDPTFTSCGCSTNANSACPSLIYSLSLEDIAEDLNITIGPANLASAALSCPQIPPLQCSNLSSSLWEYDYNRLREICVEASSCTQPGNSNDPPHCSCGSPQSCQMGQVAQPAPPADGRQSVTVWYNNQPYHMGAAALNGFYNVYLKSNNSNVNISVYNHPLPRRLEEQVTAAGDIFGFVISVLSIFGLSFLFASFIIVVVQERDSKAKHLQFVSGVQASTYWLSTYAWDLINAFIPCVLTVILFAAFQIDGYKGANIGALFLLLLFTCWAAIPLNYVMSFLFLNGLVAFCVMLLFFFFVSLAFQVSVIFVTNANSRKIMNYVFLLHPAYGLSNGLTQMYNNQLTRNACEMSELSRLLCQINNVEFTTNILDFSPPGIGHIFLYLTLEGILLFCLTILIERHFFIPEVRQLLTYKGKVADTREEAIVLFPEEDSDVADERKRVNTMTQYSDSDAVVIKNLVKEYKDLGATLFPYLYQCQGRKLAVNGINLIIPAGECFGLLGVNGAGKTTTFKILTGDITSTSGTARLSGYDINTQLRLVQQRIGYCPQFDALIERLTGRELLTMFARLRGIPEKAIKAAVKKEITRLDLGKYADKRCGTYSGGNKRKLSTAIALVGNPPILLLDEPTTGMDPATRRFLWDVLIGVIREGRSVILTSHSMEECEALCTRIAIMVNGNFKCLGSIQHLKSKFGHGYTLQLRVQPTTAPPPLERASSSRRSFRGPQSPGVGSPRRTLTSHLYDTSALQQFVTSTFPGSILLEQHQGSVTYQVPGENVTESILFRTIEQNTERFNIINYSVSQTTLDQVFINFAQEQEEDAL